MAEAGGWLEPEGRRLQRAEITQLYSSPHDMRLSLKKKKREKGRFGSAQIRCNGEGELGTLSDLYRDAPLSLQEGHVEIHSGLMSAK